MEATLDEVYPIVNSIDPKIDGFNFKKIVMAYLEGAYEIEYAQQVTRGLRPEILATHFFVQTVAGYNPTEAVALRAKFMEWTKLMEGAKRGVQGATGAVQSRGFWTEHEKLLEEVGVTRFPP
jgi:hypothetical protein